MNLHAMKGECGNCRSKDRFLFHRLLIRGVDRRVCTNCVLRLHPSLFCPSCFEFFENTRSSSSSSSSEKLIACSKCSSRTHLRCLPSSSPPVSPFLCAPCSQPAFSFFSDSDAALDTGRARVLLCACKVVSASVANSLALARARVDRTAREAALARKKARDSLDVCSVLEKMRVEGVSDNRTLPSNFNRTNCVVVTKKENLHGYIGPGQSNMVNNNNNNDNDAAKLVNRDRIVQGTSRVVDAASAKIL